MKVFQKNSEHSQYKSSMQSCQCVKFILQSGTIIANVQDRLILGRQAMDRVGQVLDLSEYGAWAAGVSQQHIYIVRDEAGHLFICDMESTHCTHLNDYKLKPHNLYPLDNGDTLRLGKLIIHVAYE